MSGKLLVELQVRKTTADGAGANSFYHTLTEPVAGWIPELRDFVIDKKQVRYARHMKCTFNEFVTLLQPRKVFVQVSVYLSAR